MKKNLIVLVISMLMLTSLVSITATANQPPEKPDTPSGPSEGQIGVEYSFTTKAIDPDGHKVYYQWAWGKSYSTNWDGPYNSGQEVTKTHIWKSGGIFNVSVLVKDEYGLEGEQSDIHQILIHSPEIRIRGELQVKNRVYVGMDIENYGQVPTEELTYSIHVQGAGLFTTKIDQEFTGKAKLDAGEILSVSTDQSFFGFGKIQILATANLGNSMQDWRLQNGLMIGRTIILMPM